MYRSDEYALLQMMGGRFRSVMPSDLVFPGACAVESLPAPGSEYASQAAKGELRRLFARSVHHVCMSCAFVLPASWPGHPFGSAMHLHCKSRYVRGQNTFPEGST